MIFLPIQNTAYIIYEDGTVMSYLNNAGNITVSPRLIKPQITNCGYAQVQLYIDKIRKVFTIHRLVAENFIMNPLNKPCVNHIDGNKLNNDKSNLEWVTHSENDIHAFKMGLRKASKKLLGRNNTKISKAVKQLTLAGELIKIWPSMAEAQRAGYSQGNITSVIQGKRTTHKKCKWELC